MKRWRAPAPVDWLERLGFSAQLYQVDEAYLDYFQDTHHIVVFSQKGQEIWLGLGVSHLFNKLCQSQDFSGLGAGVAMVADDAHGYYGFQEFARGEAGYGAQVTISPASMWTRPASSGAASPQRTMAIQSVADLLSAQASVIEACATTQGEDAAFGIAWHGQMQDWVLASMAADGRLFNRLILQIFYRLAHYLRRLILLVVGRVIGDRGICFPRCKII